MFLFLFYLVLLLLLWAASILGVAGMFWAAVLGNVLQLAYILYSRHRRERGAEEQSPIRLLVDGELSHLQSPDDIGALSIRVLGAWITRTHDHPSDFDPNTMRQHLAGARFALDQIDRLTKPKESELVTHHPTT